MSTLHILPGRLIVTFLVCGVAAQAALVVPPGRFLDGLLAASAALSFGELCRADDALEDLLPWAGNV